MLKNFISGKKRLPIYIIIVSVLLVGITLGSAFLSSTLKIIGNSKINKNSWVIYFDDIDIAEDSAPVENSNDNARISKNGVADPTKQNIEFTASLKDPGDFYEFTVWTVNDGTIDAEVESLEKSVLTEEQQKYLDFIVTYDDGTPIKECDILYHKGSTDGPNKRLVKAVVKYKSGINVNDYPTEGVTLNLFFKINYSQNVNCEHLTPESTYKLTIRPNGGIYEGRKAQTRKYLHKDEEYILSRPTRNLYNFDGWKVIDPETGGTYQLESYEDKYKFTMGSEDVIIEAKWKDGDYVARIMDHYYTKVELAFDAVDGNNPSTGRPWENNTVWLIKNTEEVALNNARSNFTFNLDGHTLTGKVINPTTGKLTLMDGKIIGSTDVEESEKQRRIDEEKNPVPFINGVSGEAVLNYGELTLGKNEGNVEVENSIAIMGSTYGLYNVSGSKFNFYDGYIDAEDAMTGISSQMVNGSIQVAPNYFIFVDHRVQDNKTYQKVYLTPTPNRAVAKTTTVIDTYYYNLQDAIESVSDTKRRNNTLTDNDYIIQAIRTFEAAYELKVENDSRIFLDMKGYGTQTGEKIINNGYFKIYNSKQNKSDIKLSKSFDNNGNLEISNINIPISTDTDGIVNEGSLKLTDVVINSHKGYCIKNTTGGTLDFDDDVILRSVHKYENGTGIDMVDDYALYNNATNVTINGGTIYGINNAGTLTLDGENLKIVPFRKYVPNTSNPQYNKAIYNTGNLTMNDGIITFNENTSVILNSGTFTYNGGTISTKYLTINNEINTTGGTLNINGGEISSENTIAKNGIINVDGGTLRTSGTDGITNSVINVKSGNVIAEDGVAIGNSCTANISGGKVTGTTYAIKTNTLNMTGGIVNGPIGANITQANISGGTINGVTNGVITSNITMDGGTINSASGVGLTINTKGTITGGEIYGGTYGTLSKGELTLGEDDGVISSTSPLIEGELLGLYIEGSTTNFYDGILKGQDDGYYGEINGTPLGGVVAEGEEDRASEGLYHTDFVASFNGWLRIGDVTYNSLDEATNAIPDGEEATIIVTRDADITFKQNIYDENKNKKITLDLNSHKVTITQNIINNSNLTIIDSPQGTYDDTGNTVGTLKVLKNDGVVNLKKIIINNGRYESITNQVFLNKVKDRDVSYIGNFDFGIEVNKAIFNVSETSIRNGIHENGTDKYGYLRINGITIENAKNGIFNAEGVLVVNGTKNSITGEYTTNITGTNYGINNESRLYVNGGHIYSSVSAISGSNGDITINQLKNINTNDDNQIASTKIESTDNFAIYSYWGDIVVNDGTITSQNNIAIDSHHEITINDGNIIGTKGIKSEEWCSWAYCGYEPINIHGGTIIGTESEGVYSTGTRGYKLNIDGGKILGQTDGVYSRSTATVGKHGGELNISNPEIRGVEGYGFNNDGGEIFFYDGILKGKRKTGINNAAHNGMIRTVEDATMVKRDYEYIYNVYYETEYLVAQGDWLEIEGKGTFNTVDKACNAAVSGDTIKVIADTHIAFEEKCEKGKNITFDLQDYSVSFTEPITFNSKMTFIGTGAFTNLRTDMIILKDESSILSGNYSSVKDGIALTNNSILNISGGRFETTNKVSIYNTGTINYNVENEESLITSTEKYAVENRGTFNLINGNITSYAGVNNNGTFVMENGKIEGTDTYSLLATGGTATIKGGEIINNKGITLNMNCSGIVYVRDTAKITSTTGNAINNSGSSSSSCQGTKLYVQGGEIVGKNNGIVNPLSSSYLEVTGGHIIGQENNGISIDTVNAKILGGIIEGNVYGLYTKQNSQYDRELRIGENDRNVAIDSPVLKGDSYGLYIENGTVNFYDGILKGQIGGYTGQITNIADRTELYYDYETINEIDYNTVYLLVESVIARNINKPSEGLSYTEYTNLQDAFNGASNGDTIVLVANAPMYYPVTNSKNITLDMAGYNISTNKPIINNGDLIIKNTSENNSIIKTASSMELITSTQELTLDNVSLKNNSTSNYVLKNTGVLSLNKVTIDSINGIDSNNSLTIVESNINAIKNAINNTGLLSINKGTYTGKNYSIYTNSFRNTTISNATLNGIYYNSGNNVSRVENSIINDEVQNRESNLTIYKSQMNDSLNNNNSTGILNISESTFNGLSGDNIINNGTMNIDKSTLNITSSMGHQGYDFVGINNNKKMTITDTDINHDTEYLDRTHVITIQSGGSLDISGKTRLLLGNINKRDGSYIGIKLIDNADATLEFDSYEITKLNGTTEVVGNIDVYGSSTATGIYVDSSNASVTLKTGFINVSKAPTTYGVYINSGTYTQGIEDGSGNENADVSRQNPKIYSAGTSKGIGVKKLNAQFNFYDGVIYAAKYAKPDTTSHVEKNYEVTTYIDNSIGYEYAWLEYMPDDYIGSGGVASITRELNVTFYDSLTEAIQFANPGEEIVLLKSTSENITINQGEIINLNLNGRSLTSKIINNGILDIYNGSIQNFEDTTIVNNGTLIMGQEEAPVSSTNIRVVSEVKAIEQNGSFIMYDGYIEGNPAINGEINQIAEFSRLYTIKDNQSEKIYLQSLDENSIRNRETALLITIDSLSGYYDSRKGKQSINKFFTDEVLIKDPIKSGCIFLGWDVVGDITLEPIDSDDPLYEQGYRNRFNVGLKDVTLTAKWQVSEDAVAKIGEEYYTTVSDAIYHAKENDTVELLKDVNEDVTNDKNITLDLGTHTLSGSFINMGILRVINGSIINPNGIGLWNKKTLLVGINDTTVSMDSVRIKGTNIGLQNDGGLKFYDGYIEGEVALNGDVESVPQGYYLYIEHNDETNCQREYLIGNPENAVAITKNNSGGEETVQYFFSLQDAIDSAGVTGKEIFIIKSFTASYEISVKENKNAIVNLNGFNIQLGNILINNGTLKIYDTYTDGDKGNIITAKTIENNGTLTIKDINITQNKSENVIDNEGILNLQNSHITGLDGYAVYNNGTLTIDNTTELNSNNYGLYNNMTEVLELNTGKISGIYTDSSLTLGGNIEINQGNTNNACIYTNKKDVNITINNINCTSSKYGIYMGGENEYLTIKNGTIVAKNNGLNIYGVSGNVVIDGGNISSTDNTGVYLRGRNQTVNLNFTFNNGTVVGYSTGINILYTNMIQNGGRIEATGSSTGYYALSVSSNSIFTMNSGVIYSDLSTGIKVGSTTIINNGEITSNYKNGYAIQTEGNLTINGGTIKATGSQSVGLRYNGSASTTTINNGSIYSKNQAIYIPNVSSYNSAKKIYVYGGNVIGDSYGIYLDNTNTTLYIGDENKEFDIENQEEANSFINSPYVSGGLYGVYANKGTMYFYNGRLRGSTYGYNKEFNAIRTSKDIFEEYEENADYIKTKTYSTTSYKAAATADSAKTGNGYAKITYIGDTNINCTNGEVTSFDYTGSESTFIAPCTGKYKLEVWGAQGGTARSTSYNGGYGGYSKGEINLISGEVLYINVGGQGTNSTSTKGGNLVIAGGYNGGGYAYQKDSEWTAGGGGATHIATHTGLLASLENDKSAILIVAGGGAGACSNSTINAKGNSGGGYIGGYSNYFPSAATQNSGFAFGQSGDLNNHPNTETSYSGGGGGYYGGYPLNCNLSSGGGSGYIANARLSNAYMYGYNVDTNVEGWVNNYLAGKTPFLKIGEHKYTSFNDADNDIQEESTVTIDVIADADIGEESVLSSNKNITIDLNGHTITMTQSLINNANLTIKDSSSNKTGKIININLDTIISNGNITLDGGTIESSTTGKYAIIVNSDNVTLNLNSDSHINGKNGIKIDKKYDSIVFNGCDIDLAGYIVYVNNYNSDITIKSGNISTTGNDGIYYSLNNSSSSVKGTLSIEGGAVTAHQTAISISSVDAVMSSGTLNNKIDSSSVATMEIRNYSTFTMSGGTISSEKASGFRTNTNTTSIINGGTITTDKYYGIYNHGGTLTINGGTIIGNGTSSSAICTDYGQSTTTINGGTITSKNIGVNLKYNSNSYNSSKTMNIYDGIITGTNYGIYQGDNRATLNIGNPEEELNIQLPKIKGNTGYYRERGIVNYYSGRLMGKTTSYDALFDLIRTNMSIHTENEVVFEDNSNVTYKSSYLVPREAFLQLNDDTVNLYNSFEEAISHIPNGGSGVIKVLESASLSEEITMPQNKNITIDLNSKTLNLTQKIINNANLTITDNSDNKEGYINNLRTTFIENNGNLTTSNVKLESPDITILGNTGTGSIILNAGTNIIGKNSIKLSSAQTLIVNGATISSSSYGILVNAYKTNVQIKPGTEITADTYGIYYNISTSTASNRSTLTIDGGTIYGTQSALFASTVNVTMNDGILLKNDDSNSNVRVGSYASFTMDGGTIKGVNCTAVSLSGSESSFTLNGGTIESNSNTINVNTSKELNINGGIVKSTGSNSSSIIINKNECHINVKGGTIQSENIAINARFIDNSYNANKTIAIYSGHIIGGIYGISLADPKTTLTIGNPETALSISDPKIEGDLYGIYKTDGTMNIYSGRLQGGTGAYFGEFSGIRGEYEIYEDMILDDDIALSYKTISTDTATEEAVSDNAKMGNGYAKITYIGETNETCTYGEETLYEYTGLEKTFEAPCAGKYKLEVWGAQAGGLYSGYGGYSTGEINLNASEILYINVGGQGGTTTTNIGAQGGYNGGGAGGNSYYTSTIGGQGGGGATHIATSSGLLSSLSNNKSSVIIVAGGGGATVSKQWNNYQGGHAGGVYGLDGQIYSSSNYSFSKGGTQDTGYAFGQGSKGADGINKVYSAEGNGGSGGGWYGGNAITVKTDSYYNAAGAGGSSYIGNSRLTNKYMIGYNSVERYSNGCVYVAYLVQTQEFIINNTTTTRYTNLQTAVDEANNGDILSLLSDASISNNVTINDNIIIDLNGHNLKTTKSIINNANIEIKNSDTNNNSKLFNSVTGKLITNNGELTINNIEISGNNSIENPSVGTLYINNSIINGSATALNNTGKFTITNSTINGNLYGIYDNSTQVNNVTNSSISSVKDGLYVYDKSTINLVDTDLSGKITNNKTDGNISIIVQNKTNINVNSLIVNKGTLTINSAIMNIAGKGEYNINFIENTGIMTLSNSNINALDGGSLNNYDKKLIYNTGTFTSSDNKYKFAGKIKGTSTNKYNYLYGIYNKSIFTSTNDEIEIYDCRKLYSIYNDTSHNTTINSIKLIEYNTSEIDYGIYNKSGNITINDVDIESYNNKESIGIYNKDSASTLTLSDLNINIHDITTKASGIKIDDGKVTVSNGSIVSSSSTAYGIEMVMGEYVQGIKEGTGIENNNVSITNPNINATGTQSGIGVSMGNGTFRFFDGYVHGSTSAFGSTDIISETELRYHLKYTDNNKTATLEFDM